MAEVRAVIDHAEQSAYSDPGAFASLFDEVEPTIESVSEIARNIVAHYRAFAQQLPESSRDDISLRWMDAILATDQHRHANTPLSTQRRLRDRVQGCCRDHTLLCVAALRHHGIPARSRVGFATYIEKAWNYDHVIVEAWIDGRWRCFDSEFSQPRDNLPDPTDIALGENGPFRTAANVWRGHRNGTLDINHYGVAPGLPYKGDWFVYGYVIGEIAHRFGDELLLWDQWGAMHGDLTRAPAEHITLIDDICDLLVKADEGDLGAERELLERYTNDERLRPATKIHSVSPNGGFFEVDLATRAASLVS